MNYVKSLLPLGIALHLLTGCSVYHAAHAPTPVEYKVVKLGDTRTETIDTLGYPKMSDQKNHLKVDTFEFQDGYHAASKSRMLVYLASDIFTVGLAEFILWPMEENIFDGLQCKGTISYDKNDKVVAFDFEDKDGDTLYSSSALFNEPQN